MYESPEYHDLKRNLTHWESVLRWVDIARMLNAMSYDGAVTITSEGRFNNPGRSVLLPDAARAELLKSASEYCIARAVLISTEKVPAVDIERAAHV